MALHLVARPREACILTGFLCRVVFFVCFFFFFLVDQLSMLCLEYLTFISGAVFIYTLLPISLGLVPCPQSSDSHSSPGLIPPKDLHGLSGQAQTPGLTDPVDLLFLAATVFLYPVISLTFQQISHDFL